MNATDLVGKVLDGRYRVVSQLGAGSMATVYLAHQETLDREVVVKIPNDALAADEDFLLRFRQEIRSLTKLRHPRIVSILEAGEVDGVPYAVMDYLEGGNLKDRLSDLRDGGSPVARTQVLEWLSPLARALDFIHGKGVIHRDVKPANLLFDGEGNVYLSDFGIAKALGPMESELTRTGSTVGTALYMAPEQGLDGTITGAADQYALAVIAFEMICGRTPNVGATSPVIMVQKLTEDAPEIRDLAPELPESAASAIMRALDWAPGNRFPSCSAFIEAFAGVSGGGDEAIPVVAEAEGEDDSGLADPTDTAFAPVAMPMDESEESAGLNELTGTYVAPAARAPATDPEGAEDPSAAFEPSTLPSREDEPAARKRRRGILIAGVVAAIIAAGLLVFSGGGGSGPGSGTTPPEIQLTIDRSPLEGQLLATSSVEVAGRIRGDPEVWVELAGDRVDLGADGSFAAVAMLEEGRNVFALRVLHSGGELVETRKFAVEVDTRAPGIVLDAVPEGLLVRDPRLAVGGRVVDLHPEGVTVSGSAATLGTDGAFQAECTLTEGRNELVVRARDKVGNESVESRIVTLDSRAPKFSLDRLPAVTAETVLTVTGTVHEYYCRVLVNGIPATLVETRFYCPVPLAVGRNTIETVVEDLAGNRATSTVSLVLDTRPPSVRLDPLPEVTGEARIPVTGEVDHPDTRVTVNGVGAKVDGTRFTCEIPLTPGENRIRAIAVGPAGLSASVEETVVLDHEPPTVRLDPLPESTAEARVEVSGEVSEESCAVVVNGLEAEVAGSRYSCEVPLTAGENVIEVVATDRAGHSASARIVVHRNLVTDSPPRVHIDPLRAAGSSRRITISGSVDRDGCGVTVNGLKATVTGRKYTCVVPFTLDLKEIVVIATDPSGRMGGARARVRVQDR